MSQIDSLFVTRLYQAKLAEHGAPLDQADLEASCLSIAEDDEAGQTWCEENGYAGYTSYASLDDLPWRLPIFKDLQGVLDQHVAAFVDDLQFDLNDRPLTLDSPVDQHPAGRRHPYIACAPAQRHQRHHLCQRAQGGQHHQV